MPVSKSSSKSKRKVSGSSFDRVALIGIGLMGGSLGLVLRRKRLAKEVVGFSRSAANRQMALRRGLINKAASTVEEAVRGADLVVLGTPVRSIPSLLKEIAPYLKPAAIVMDVGSTKEGVLKAAQEFMPLNRFFIGAHPIAGTEQSGPEAAFLGLYEGKKCLLTPAPRVPPAAVALIRALWTVAGSTVLVMPAAKHDAVLARTSHLPQLTAYALIKAVAKGLSLKDMTALSGTGLRDTTRIAASSADMWHDIVLENQKNLIDGLRRLETEIKNLIRLLAKGDSRSIRSYFKAASLLRRKLK